MRKYLLLALSVLFAVAAKADYNTTSSWSADYDYDEIPQLTAENDTIAPEWTSYYSYLWYKYTPEENQVMSVLTTSVSGSSGGLYIYYWDGENDAISSSSIKSCSVYKNSVTTYYYLLEADKDYYFRLQNYGLTFYLVLNDASGEFDNGDNLCVGWTDDDPQDIADEGTYFVGYPYGSSYNDLYLAYTASDDGVLKIYSYKYVSEATVTDLDGNETTVSFESDYTTSPTTYKGKITVEKGMEYYITINSYYLLYFYTMFVQPTEGDEDLPFELVEGDNTIPAAAGTYWYTYNNGNQTGYATLTGEATGDNWLGVWDGSYGLGSTSYADATGTYGCTFEMYYEDTDYTVIVYKTTATDEDETLTFAVEDYAEGETSSNPIIITETPYYGKVRGGSGGYSAYYQYYQITIPEGDDQIMEIVTTSEITSDGTSIYVNESGTWNYESGTSIKMEVTAGSTYSIEVDSYETDSLYFTLTLTEPEQGDIMSNPLIAYDGDNTVPKAGTLYYKYTATSDGKFQMGVKGTDITALFIDASTLNNYYYSYLDDTYSDSTYFFEVAENDSMIIVISDAAADDVFTIEIGEYGEGESKATAINVNELDSCTYHISKDNGLNPIWLKYTTETEGGLTIEGHDMTRTYYNDVYYYKPTSTSASSLYSSSYAKYYADFNVGADEDYYVYLLIDDDYWSYVDGGYITFTERDYGDGEIVEKAIELTVNQVDTISLAASPSNNPVWYKVYLGVGDVDFAFSEYPQYKIYKGEDNALAGTSWTTSSVVGTSQSSYTLSDGQTVSYWRVYSTTIEEQDWYYIYQTYGYYSDFYINVQGTEPSYPDYDLEYVSVDPQGATTDDELDALESIDGLESVTLTYDVKVGLADATAVIAYTATGDTVTSTAVADSLTVTITFDEAISTTATWYVEIPQGTIGDSTYVASGYIAGHANDSLVLSYVVVAPFDEGTITIEPEAGDTVNSLLDFTLTYGDLYAAYPTTLITPYLIDATTGETVTTATTKDKYSNYVTITLAEEVTDEGTYTLVIPAGTYYLEDYTYYEVKNDSLAFTYVVVMPDLTHELAIESVDPSEDETVSELSTITLYFAEPVYINPNGSDDTNYSTTVALYNYSTREEVTTATLSQDAEGDSTIIVTLADAVTDEGTYRLYLPQGVVGDATAYKYDFVAGNLNARLSTAALFYVAETSEEDTDGISSVNANGSDSYHGISADANGNFNVYTISGIRMMTTKSTSDIDNLPTGLYIINGTKAALK